MAFDPDKPLLNDYTTGTLIDAQGNLLHRPTLILTLDEARLLRSYKKFLLNHRLQEAPVRCRDCFEGNRTDFHHFFVTDTQIQYSCGCRMLFYSGPTY